MKKLLAKTAAAGAVGLAAVGIGAGVASAHPADTPQSAHGDAGWNGDRGGDAGRTDGLQGQWQAAWERLPQVGQPAVPPRVPEPATHALGSLSGSL